MASKPTAQQCHALTTYYINAHAEATGRAPVVNRNKARWSFEAILMDFSPKEAKELIDYYTEHYEANSLSIEWFLFNYDKVYAAKQEHEENEQRQNKRRLETQKRLDEWKKRWEK